MDYFFGNDACVLKSIPSSTFNHNLEKPNVDMNNFLNSTVRMCVNEYLFILWQLYHVKRLKDRSFVLLLNKFIYFLAGVQISKPQTTNSCI